MDLFVKCGHGLANHLIPYIYLQNYNYIPIYVWTNDKNVQEALHVREGSIEQWVRCNKTLSGFTIDVNNTVPNHQRLTHKFIRALTKIYVYLTLVRWSGSNRSKFQLPQTGGHNSLMAKYTTKYSNSKYRLTYTTIKGGGHTAPEYKPKEALSMIDKWLARYPL
ncbi:hypothetical protein V2J09_013478 [Rumex salicifolius]